MILMCRMGKQHIRTQESLLQESLMTIIIKTERFTKTLATKTKARLFRPPQPNLTPIPRKHSQSEPLLHFPPFSMPLKLNFIKTLHQPHE